MSSLNKVLIIGRVGKDPETRYLPNGDAVCTFSVATSESWKDKNTGEKHEHTEWHNVVCWRRLGEIAAQYLKKGSLVYVEGKIKTEKWQDKETGQDRYTTKIEATELTMLGKRGESGQEAGESDAYRAASGASQHRTPPLADSRPRPPQPVDFDDDIPF